MITVANAITQIRFRWNLEGFEDRYSDTYVRAILTRGLRHLRERCVRVGGKSFLTTASITTAAGATSPFLGTVVLVSATVPVVEVLSVELRPSATQSVPLVQVTEADIPSLGLTPDRTGQPQVWCPIGLDDDVKVSPETTLGSQRILLLPATDKAYSAVVRYLPELADLGASDSFACTAEQLEWLELLVGRTIFERDSMLEQAAYCRSAQAELERRILADEYDRSTTGDVRETQTVSVDVNAL